VKVARAGTPWPSSTSSGPTCPRCRTRMRAQRIKMTTRSKSTTLFASWQSSSIASLPRNHRPPLPPHPCSASPSSPCSTSSRLACRSRTPISTAPSPICLTSKSLLSFKTSHSSARKRSVRSKVS
ncbi:hypothetical protein OC844_007995, partial [Tilletia horrida]